MDKKESRKAEDLKNSTFKNKKLKSSTNSKLKREKPLPWWVELLFVQIGLPDKMLLKILKSKKLLSELVKNEKRIIFSFMLALTAFAYFYPVIKYSKTKLDCQAIAKNYIKENKNLIKINKKRLRMLSTNICNGGNVIYEIENINE